MCTCTRCLFLFGSLGLVVVICGIYRERGHYGVTREFGPLEDGMITDSGGGVLEEEYSRLRLGAFLDGPAWALEMKRSGAAKMRESDENGTRESSMVAEVRKEYILEVLSSSPNTWPGTSAPDQSSSNAANTLHLFFPRASSNRTRRHHFSFI